MISYKPFRMLIVEHNIEVTKLSKMLHISPATMTKLNAKKEDNEPVSLKTIEKLCKYFNVTIDKIVEIK